jgi:hypothetical protein
MPLRILLYGLLLFAIHCAAPKTARAEESACRANGSDVTCTRVGFDKLMSRLTDEMQGKKTATIQRDAAEARAYDLEDALLKCSESIPPPPPPPPSALRRVLPVVLGIVGAGVLVGSVAIDAPAGVQVSGAVVGLAAVTAGIVLSF